MGDVKEKVQDMGEMSLPPPYILLVHGEKTVNNLVTGWGKTCSRIHLACTRRA
jgi:hypothetical protein